LFRGISNRRKVFPAFFKKNMHNHILLDLMQALHHAKLTNEHQRQNDEREDTRRRNLSNWDFFKEHTPPRKKTGMTNTLRKKVPISHLRLSGEGSRSGEITFSDLTRRASRRKRRSVFERRRSYSAVNSKRQDGKRIDRSTSSISKSKRRKSSNKQNISSSGSST
jgi:hypothetical protein